MRPFGKLSFALLLSILPFVTSVSWCAESTVLDAPPVVKSVPPPDPKAAAAPSQDEFPLLEEVMKLNQIQEPEIDLPAMRTAFKKVLAELEPKVSAAKTAREKIAVMNSILLNEREVSYLSNIYWRDAFLAASLMRKKGNCLATSTLYMVAGKALGLPIKLVCIPGHAFVRWDDGKTHINIETTSQGREIADSDYYTRTNLGAADRELLGWGSSQDEDALIGMLQNCAGNFRWSQNKLEEAVDLYRAAATKLPWGAEVELRAIQVEADLTGDRRVATQKVLHLLESDKLPPSLRTNALVFLAKNAAGLGDHERERKILMAAFKEAPKSQQCMVLQELAFCLRALKDYHGGSRFMELAVVLTDDGPEMASVLYNLAILQKHDGRLTDALESIKKGRTYNPESWNLKLMEAGYRYLNGEKEEGLKEFAEVQRPKDDADFFAIMQAWFYAATKQKEKFYEYFEKCLSGTKTMQTLEWIDQDADLDPYRNDPEFKALVEKHAKRLRGQ